MKVQPIAVPTAGQTDQDASVRTRLSGTWLLVARTTWISITLLNVFLLILSVPAEYALQLATAQEKHQPFLSALGLSNNFYATYLTAIDMFEVTAFVLIGAFIFWFKSDDWMVMLVSLALITFGSLFVPPLISLAKLQPQWIYPVGFIRALGLALSLIVFYYLFPNGQFVPRWSRILAAVWFALTLFWLLFPNAPANLIYLDSWLGNLPLSIPVFLFCYLTGVGAQIYRYRRVSSPLERQKTKWVVFGTTAAVFGFAFHYLPLVAFPTLTRSTMLGLQHTFGSTPFYYFLILFAPLSIGFAVLSFRLWDIDLIVNRSLVYGALSVVLAALYFGLVFAFQQASRMVINQETDLAVVASTLVIMALFNPVRRKVQDGIDQRFYRQKFDAGKTLETFASNLRHEVELDKLVEKLEGAVWETMQPAHVLTWLSSPTGYRVAIPGGKSSPYETAVGMGVEVAADDPLVDFLQSTSGPVEIADLEVDSPGVRKFQASRVKMLVPLVGQGELVGWLSLGARLSEREYSAYDRYLLGNLAVRAAPVVQVAQLVREKQAEAMEREQLQHELELARLIQQTLLPKEPPQLPGWHIATYYQPARAVGGDFYDFIPLPDGQYAIVIGDVSDKGVPAALVMATTRSILRGAAKRLISPGAVLARANELLHPEIPSPMFVTCLYLVVDPVQERIWYANAGHNLPLRRVDGRVEQLWATGMPLGLMPDMEYEEFEMPLDQGDCILLYSDGLTEAHNTWQEMFGGQRLRSIIESEPGNSTQVIEGLLRELRNFTGAGWEQEDDVTLVVIKRLDDLQADCHEPVKTG